MYEVYSNLFKTKIVKVGYKNFKVDKQRLYQIIRNKNVKILFLPNPNQPIEDNFSFQEIKKFVKSVKKIKSTCD